MFRLAKSCTSQLLNLTQHIEDTGQRGMITGTTFVDHDVTHNSINTDNLYITAQHTSFNQETTVDVALGELKHDYRTNSLRANPDKTKVTAFQLRIKEAKRSLNIKWKNSDLENTAHHKYLGIALDMTISYKEHLLDTPKMKLATWNNIMRKLENYKWGTNVSIIRKRALALLVANYATTVKSRSKHVHLLDPELNQAYRVITGCLQPTNVEELYFLAGIAPSDIRKYVCIRIERAKQINHKAFSLFGHIPATNHLKS